MASHARYKEFRSVKWTVRKSSLNLCARFLFVADNLEVLYTSAFLTKVYGTLLIDAVCEILHAPKRFFGDVSFYAVSIGSNLVKDIYTCMQFLIPSSSFTAVERIPHEKFNCREDGAARDNARTASRTASHCHYCELGLTLPSGLGVKGHIDPNLWRES